MKLKFLSIFLALGMFVLGTGLKAENEESAKVESPEIGCSSNTKERLDKWKTMFLPLFEKAISSDKTVITACQPLMDAINTTNPTGVTKDNITNCSTAIDKSKDTELKTLANAAIMLHTKLLCTGSTFSCKSCKDPVIAGLCGGLGCSVAAKELGACVDFFPGKACPYQWQTK